MMDEAKWEVIQFRIDPIMKQRIHLWCRSNRIPLSVLLRIVCAKILNIRENSFGRPTEATQEVDLAVTQVDDFVPTIVKQRERGHRIY